MERVQAAVTEIFGPLNPREDISLSKLSELTVQLRMKVEGSTEEDRRYILCKTIVLILLADYVQVSKMAAISAASS